jgi:hypothetical protein
MQSLTNGTTDEGTGVAAVGIGPRLPVLARQRANVPRLIRTSLAILAGAVAIDQLTPDIAPAPVRIGLCVMLAIVGAVLAGQA